MVFYVISLAILSSEKYFRDDTSVSHGKKFEERFRLHIFMTDVS